MTIQNRYTNIKNKLNIHALLLPTIVTIFFILMFIFPSSTLTGAESGLLLWFNVIVPTLLPCIIISNLIVSLNVTKYICFLFSPILTRLFGISKTGCYPIIIGLLSGFPLGAKTCSDMVNQGKISTFEGQYLSSLCNNASYMFITSYIALTNLNLPKQKYQLLSILYISAILSSFLYRLYITRKRLCQSKQLSTTSLSTTSSKASSNSILNKGKEIIPIKLDFSLVDDAIMNGFEVITKIGGYIILFSILANIITDIGPQNSLITYVGVGLLEITTGIDCINRSALDMGIKIVLILSITSFGGFSSIAQTKSVIANSRLSIRTYINVKLLNMIITAILTALYVSIIF